MLHSESENKFRIIRDQGNGTVCAFTLDTDCTPRDSLGGKVLKSLWHYVDGDYAKLIRSCSNISNYTKTPIKTSKKQKNKKGNKSGKDTYSPKNKKKKTPIRGKHFTNVNRNSPKVVIEKEEVVAPAPKSAQKEPPQVQRQSTVPPTQQQPYNPPPVMGERQNTYQHVAYTDQIS